MAAAAKIGGGSGERLLSGGTLPFSAFLHAPQTRVEGITPGVSQKIEAKHSYADSEARRRK